MGIQWILLLPINFFSYIPLAPFKGELKEFYFCLLSFINPSLPQTDLGRLSREGIFNNAIMPLCLYAFEPLSP